MRDIIRASQEDGEERYQFLSLAIILSLWLTPLLEENIRPFSC